MKEKNTSIYGLAQYWHYIGKDKRPAYYNAACKSYLSRASLQLHKLCPLNRGAIIWVIDCLLKHSDSLFFGRIDMDNALYEMSSEVVDNPNFTYLQLRINCLP